MSELNFITRILEPAGRMESKNRKGSDYIASSIVGAFTAKKKDILNDVRPRNLLLNNDAKPLNDKRLHDKLDIQDTGCSFLVAGYSLLVVDKSNSFASSQNRRSSPLFFIKLIEYLILTSNE